jgi:NTE family protein
MMRTALVLSGGALLGVGWELGVLRGMQDGGVHIGGFAKVIGTSAGAMVGAIAASGGPVASDVMKRIG